MATKGITHKGISMLLKHHALDPMENTDDDVKNCVDAAIKNSDAPEPEEIENSMDGGDDDEGDEEVVNRADEEAAKVLAEKDAKIAELEKKLKEKPKPLYNRADARDPQIEIEETSNAGELERREKISNRAAELEAKGVPPTTAYNRAYAQFPSKSNK